MCHPHAVRRVTQFTVQNPPFSRLLAIAAIAQDKFSIAQTFLVYFPCFRDNDEAEELFSIVYMLGEHALVSKI